MAADPNNPYLRQPLHRRFTRSFGESARAAGRAALLVPRAFYGMFRRSPLVLRILLVVVALGVFGVGGTYAYQRRAKGQEQRQILDGWREFENEVLVGGGDPEELLPILDKILAVNPSDPTAQKRKAALERRTADPDDQPMVVLLLRQHLRNRRHEEAAVEAAKRLADSPNDHWSHLAIAQYELVRGKPDLAEPHLKALAHPEDVNANADPGSLMYAMQIFRALNRDAAPLRQFLIVRLLPKFRGEAVTLLKPGLQAVLLACYAEAFAEGPDAGSTLAEFWAPASRIAGLALKAGAAAEDTRALANLGEVGLKLANGLTMLHGAKLVTDDERKTLGDELETRTRAAWDAVRAKEPANPAAYYGLALSHLRSGRANEAAKAINDGVAACPDDLRLTRLLAWMLQREDRADDALKVATAAAERNPNLPAWWLFVAEAAQGANRRDKAIAALRKAQDVAPNQPGPMYAEARLLVEAGKAADALVLLKKLKEESLARDPEGARAYAHALTETNGPAEGFLNRVEELGNAANSPAAIVAAYRGYFEAPVDAARTERVVRAMASVRTRWPDDANVALLRAESLMRKLEYGPPAWDQATSRDAARAGEVALALNAGNQTAAAGLALVRLRGLNDPSAAATTVATLTASGEPLAPFAVEVAGQVLLAANRVEDAYRLLDTARQSRQATAGCWVQLAHARFRRGQKLEASEALLAAGNLPQTPRERADFQAARALIRQEFR